MRSSRINNALRAKIVTQLPDFSNVPKDAYQAIAACALQGRISLTATGIELVRRAGVHESVVMELLAQAGDTVSIENLRIILRNVGGKYAIVADKGRKSPKFENTEENGAILQRLKDARIVANFVPEDGKHLRVSLRRV